MKAKKHVKENQKKRKRNQRKTTSKTVKAWHPLNYLMESHPEVEIPECESVTLAYAWPL
jgi:hypothetical protein